MMRRCRFPLLLRVLALVALPFLAYASLAPTSLDAQGVTTAAIDGRVQDADGQPRSGAHIMAVHVPSGTTYSTISRADGRFSIPGMRVGGPYRLSVSYIGYETSVIQDIHLNLGMATDIQVDLRQTAIELEGIRVTATDAIFSSERTGAATSVSRSAIEAMPTISRRIEDFARLTPQYSGTGFGFSFAGQDNRLNNVTVDGSYFNNSFGLAGQPGDRTGVAPISTDAIEQLHVNIAPYDVRQGNFVGAGVNTVTRSGTNQLRGSLYYMHRNEGFVGSEARGLPVDPGTFRFNQIGGWLAGPLIQNRLFYFVSVENEGLTEPATTFRANRGGETVEGGVTRVEAGILDDLSAYLATNFGYETGPYQGYDHETPAFRFLSKIDYNIDDRNKLSLRYTHLDSRTDVLASNSSSLGFGNRRTNSNALNFRNSNYIIQENIRSVVAELNSMVRPNMANNLIVGYTYHDESRDSRGTFFPTVDILDAGSTFTTFGFEPFTPNNELRYGSLQLQNSFTIFGPRHSWTFGVSAERYKSENVFFPGSQSVYVYNSIDDFYADANGHLANPNRTQSPVELRRFQVRWSNIPGQEKPVQPLEVFFTGVYAQNVWQVSRDLKLTVGARLDVPFFGDTGFRNAEVDGMSFRDELGNTVRFSTDKLPDPNPLFSPRFGFNWDVLGNQATQLRGGSGIFTGRPAYVWISNQIGENGVLTGFEQIDNTDSRPFNPDPNHYKPSSVSGEPASSYGLAFTDPDFRFPQLWRSNVAVDQRLPFGLIATAEFMYSRDVNGIYYINANLREPNASFAGPDARPRWTGPDLCPEFSGTQNNRINCSATSAIVLKNQNDGYSWNTAFSLERPFADGAFVKAAYSYGVAKNTIDPGSIAFGSWNNNPHSGDPNNPGIAYASTSPGHRVFLAGSYRAELFSWGATTLSLFWQGYTAGNGSYTFAGDINGDGGTSNDLIYIPLDASEMNFQTYTTGGVTFTAQEQAAAWERFITQDRYLRDNRGSYVERNAIFLPMVYRTDLTIAQDVFTDRIRGGRNGLQLRFDVLNVGNLLNSDWGASYRFTSTQPLISAGADGEGRAQYRMRAIGGELISESFERTASISDVYRIQMSVRYTFN